VALPHQSEGQELTPIGKAWTQVGSHQEQQGTQQVQVGTDPTTGAPIYEEQPVYVTVADYDWVPFSELRNSISTTAARYTQDQWYAYDSMNRQVLVDGAASSDVNNVGGNLTSDQGHILTYDLTGNRTSDTHIGRVVTEITREYVTDEAGQGLLNESGKPSYGYDESGALLPGSYYSASLGLVTENCVNLVGLDDEPARGIASGQAVHGLPGQGLTDGGVHAPCGEVIGDGPECDRRDAQLFHRRLGFQHVANNEHGLADGGQFNRRQQRGVRVQCRFGGIEHATRIHLRLAQGAQQHVFFGRANGILQHGRNLRVGQAIRGLDLDVGLDAAGLFARRD